MGFPCTGDGDGQSRDGSYYLLDVWGRDCAALPCQDLPQGFPGHRAHWQCKTDRNCGSCVWQGQWYTLYTIYTYSLNLLCPSLLPSNFTSLDYSFPDSCDTWMCHRRSWGQGRRPWFSSNSSSIQNTWRWERRCSSERAWPKVSAMSPSYNPSHIIIHPKARMRKSNVAQRTTTENTVPSLSAL